MIPDVENAGSLVPFGESPNGARESRALPRVHSIARRLRQATTLPLKWIALHAPISEITSFNVRF